MRVCENSFKFTSLLQASQHSILNSLDSWATSSSPKQKYQPGSGSCTLGETTSSSQEMLISVICCVTGRAAVEPLGDSALADEELFSVASMIWMAEDSEVGLLVTLLEAAGTEQTPSVNETLEEQSVSPTRPTAREDVQRAETRTHCANRTDSPVVLPR